MSETSDNNEVTEDEAAKTEKEPLSKGAAILGKIMLSFFTLLILFIFFEIALKKKDSTFSIDTDPNYDRQERNYYPQEKRMNPWVKRRRDAVQGGRRRRFIYQWRGRSISRQVCHSPRDVAQPE